LQTVPTLSEKFAAFRSFVASEHTFILAAFASSGAGYLGSTAAPFLLDALYKSGLNYQQAGDLGMVELLTLAVVATLIGPIVPRFSHRKLAFTGCLMAAAGVATSAMCGVDDYALMMVGRLITGTGSALAISGANAAVAAREDAERIFALIWTMGGGITAALPQIMPRLADLEFGMDSAIPGGNYRTCFGLMFVGCFAFLYFIRNLPPRPASLATTAPSADSGDASAETSAAGRLSSGDWVLGGMALAGMLIYSIAEMALWQFAYTIPVTESGLDEDLVAYVLTCTTIAGLSGGAIAAWLGTRVGRVIPITVGMLINLVGQVVFLSATTPAMLWIGGVCWGLGFYFVSPFQIGLVAALDRRGRLAVASGAAMNYGYALGPGIAGRTLENLDKNALVMIIAGMTVTALLLFLPLAIRVNKKSD
jgi:MFS family permease